jgi:heptosyltransferase-2
MFSLDDLNAVHNKLRRLLDEAGVSLAGVYFCPHHPDEGCRCRKPGTGMVDQAVKDLHLDLSRAYVVGDQARDMVLAKQVGAKGVLVLTGEGSAEALRELETKGAPPDAVAASLGEAVDWILADAQTHHASRITHHGSCHG